MSHVWTSYVTHTTGGSIDFKQKLVSTHIWMSHVTPMNESCHTYERVTSHIRLEALSTSNIHNHLYVCRYKNDYLYVCWYNDLYKCLLLQTLCRYFDRVSCIFTCKCDTTCVNVNTCKCDMTPVYLHVNIPETLSKYTGVMSHLHIFTFTQVMSHLHIFAFTYIYIYIFLHLHIYLHLHIFTFIGSPVYLHVSCHTCVTWLVTSHIEINRRPCMCRCGRILEGPALKSFYMIHRGGWMCDMTCDMTYHLYVSNNKGLLFIYIKGLLFIYVWHDLWHDLSFICV